MFLLLAAGSVGLWLSVAGPPLVGLQLAGSEHLWSWTWTLIGWLSLVVTPLWLTLALAAWRPTTPLHSTLRVAGIGLFAAMFAAAVIAAVVLGVVGWIASERVVHPDVAVEDYELSQFDLSVEEVRFRSADGLLLSGWFIPGTNRATIVLAHGYGHTRAETLPHADYLHRAGYSVLVFDFRSRGESEGDETTGGLREPLDIQGAVDYLTSRGDVDPKRIGAQGISLGAASTLMAAASTPEIRAVVAESAFSSLRGVVATSFEHFAGFPAFPFAPVTTFITERRLEGDADDVVPTEAIARISPRPVLLIHDLDDDVIPGDSGNALYAAASEPKDLWLVAGADHAKAWQQEPAEYERRVLAFWKQALSGP
jgi:dipeptidyl aminopeptidase/acylaminoacyl peptidase